MLPLSHKSLTVVLIEPDLRNSTVYAISLDALDHCSTFICLWIMYIAN